MTIQQLIVRLLKLSPEKKKEKIRLHVYDVEKGLILDEELEERHLILDHKKNIILGIV
jgi:hypothetical protein